MAVLVLQENLQDEGGALAMRERDEGEGDSLGATREKGVTWRRREE